VPSGVTRTAYQRLYDMILSHGIEDVYENKDKIPRYKFFTEFATRHSDAIYGLDRPLMQLVNMFKIYPLSLSAENRIGIGTFQPKDEKNQDSTELTGDINYRKIAEYGFDSDLRAFNFGGEQSIAKRGIAEFIEMLKLDLLLSVGGEEYEDIVKNEVQRAITADEDALIRLCGNYIDNVRAYTQREKVRNRYTGNYEEPDVAYPNSKNRAEVSPGSV
jgi:predicted Ser/Thr protein kinase